MMDLITRYWQSQAVGVAARFGVADGLAGGERTAKQVAKLRGIDEAATLRLLRALAAMGVVAQVKPGVFRNTPLGETLRGDVPGSMRDFAIALTAPGHWLPWGKFNEVVVSGDRATPKALGAELFDYYAANPTEGQAFSGAMNGLSSLSAGEVADLWLAPKGSTVVDVGGAHGQLLASMLEADPSLKGVLFDTAGVVATAAPEIAARGLADRCKLVAGDFFVSAPAGDVYLLKHILHDWGDEQCVTILRNCRTSLNPGGKVLIVEMVLPEDDTPTVAQMMDLNMLVMLPGKERTLAEYGNLCRAAGLTVVAAHPTHSPYTVVEARAS
jgi:hypothetical protein